MTPSRRVPPLDTGPIYDDLIATANEAEENMAYEEERKQEAYLKGEDYVPMTGPIYDELKATATEVEEHMIADALIEGSGE